MEIDLNITLPPKEKATADDPQRSEVWPTLLMEDEFAGGPISVKFFDAVTQAVEFAAFKITDKVGYVSGDKRAYIFQGQPCKIVYTEDEKEKTGSFNIRAVRYNAEAGRTEFAIKEYYYPQQNTPTPRVIADTIVRIKVWIDCDNWSNDLTQIFSDTFTMPSDKPLDSAAYLGWGEQILGAVINDYSNEDYDVPPARLENEFSGGNWDRKPLCGLEIGGPSGVASGGEAWPGTNLYYFLGWQRIEEGLRNSDVEKVWSCGNGFFNLYIELKRGTSDPPARNTCNPDIVLDHKPGLKSKAALNQLNYQTNSNAEVGLYLSVQDVGASSRGHYYNIGNDNSKHYMYDRLKCKGFFFRAFDLSDTNTYKVTTTCQYTAPAVKANFISYGNEYEIYMMPRRWAYYCRTRYVGAHVVGQKKVVCGDTLYQVTGRWHQYSVGLWWDRFPNWIYSPQLRSALEPAMREVYVWSYYPTDPQQPWTYYGTHYMPFYKLDTYQERKAIDPKAKCGQYNFTFMSFLPGRQLVYKATVNDSFEYQVEGRRGGEGYVRAIWEKIAGFPDGDTWIPSLRASAFWTSHGILSYPPEEQDYQFGVGGFPSRTGMWDNIPYGCGISPDKAGALMGIVRNKKKNQTFYVWRKTDETFEFDEVKVLGNYEGHDLSFERDGVSPCTALSLLDWPDFSYYRSSLTAWWDDTPDGPIFIDQFHNSGRRVLDKMGGGIGLVQHAHYHCLGTHDPEVWFWTYKFHGGGGTVDLSSPVVPILSLERSIRWWEDVEGHDGGDIHDWTDPFWRMYRTVKPATVGFPNPPLEPDSRNPYDDNIQPV